MKNSKTNPPQKYNNAKQFFWKKKRKKTLQFCDITHIFSNFVFRIFCFSFFVFRIFCFSFFVFRFCFFRFPFVWIEKMMSSFLVSCLFFPSLSFGERTNEGEDPVLDAGILSICLVAISLSLDNFGVGFAYALAHQSMIPFKFFSFFCFF